MLHQIDDKQLEQKARLFYKDGIFETAMGLSILLVYLSLQQEPGTFVIFFILLPLMMKAVKKLITFPRLQAMEFTPHPYQERRARQVLEMGIITLALLLLVGLTAFYTDYLQAFLESAGSIWGVLTLIFAAMFAVFGWESDEKRLGAYALLGILVWVVGLWAGASVQAFLGFGAIALIGGIGQMIYFIRHYPLGKVTSVQ